MSIQEMKDEIISKVKETEDEGPLEQFCNMLQSSGKDHYPLSVTQMQRVEEALAQYRRGEYLTDEEAEKELDKWFKED